MEKCGEKFALFNEKKSSLYVKVLNKSAFISNNNKI